MTPAGRVDFTSYPSASSAPDKGVWNDYDALGRVTAVTQDSELGLLTTTTKYGSGFKTTVTNPRLYATTTSYQTFDQPSTDAPVSIAAPESVTTTISRDPFGKPLSIARNGTYAGSAVSLTRRYVYDEYQQLCKTINPESGATVIEYDGAGNVLWTADGQALPSTSLCGPRHCRRQKRLELTTPKTGSKPWRRLTAPPTSPRPTTPMAR
jgi:hypothetical protein